MINEFSIKKTLLEIIESCLTEDGRINRGKLSDAISIMEAQENMWYNED